MAGVKGRSGRKKETAVLSCREIIDSVVTAADWRVAWKKVKEAAKKGDLPAMRLMTEYRYGQPQKDGPPASPMGSVVYYLPYRQGQLLPGGTVPQEGPDGKIAESERVRQNG